MVGQASSLSIKDDGQDARDVATKSSSLSRLKKIASALYYLQDFISGVCL